MDMKIPSFIFALSCLCSSADAAITVAAHSLPVNATSWGNSGAGIGIDNQIYDNRLAQTFVPTATGYLADISFNVYRIDTNADLRISITSVVGGQPATVLDSVLLPFTAVGTTSLSSSFLKSGAFSHTVTTSGTLLVNTGVTYALVFSSDTTNANYRIYSDSSGYADGTRLRYQNGLPFTEAVGSDVLFRVTATPIPEPQTALFGCMTTLMVILRRRTI